MGGAGGCGSSHDVRFPSPDSGLQLINLMDKGTDRGKPLYEFGQYYCGNYYYTKMCCFISLVHMFVLCVQVSPLRMPPESRLLLIVMDCLGLGFC